MRALLPAAAFWLPAQRAWPCSVCFGSLGADFQRGYFWGILLLLLLPAILVAAISIQIVRCVRKKNRPPDETRDAR